MLEVYADGADVKSILEMNDDPFIKGFTTNPTLMKKAGIKDYERFAKEILSTVKTKPVSFEVFADDFLEMERQAIKISQWGDNVYVKIPIMTTKEQSNLMLMSHLSEIGIKINATAIMDYSQITDTINALDTDTPSIISIFAGRIADTLRNPCYYVEFGAVRKKPLQQILWASTREAYNYIQAELSNADIITVPNDIILKLKSMNARNLYAVSLDTVKMFYKDAVESGFIL